MKANELLPCPFCRGEAEVHNCGMFENEKLSVIFDGRMGVHCSVCGVATTPYASEEDAIKAWNSRADTKPPDTITWYDRIRAMPIDEMASFFVYLNSRGVIATADRYICKKCKAEHNGHCSIGDDDKCLYDMSDKETIKLWLECDAYEYGA